MLDLALSRRPRALSPRRQRVVLLLLLDLVETARRNPEWASDVSAIVRGIAGVTA